MGFWFMACCSAVMNGCTLLDLDASMLSAEYSSNWLLWNVGINLQICKLSKHRNTTFRYFCACV